MNRNLKALGFTLLFFLVLAFILYLSHLYEGIALKIAAILLIIFFVLVVFFMIREFIDY